MPIATTFCALICGRQDYALLGNVALTGPGHTWIKQEIFPYLTVCHFTEIALLSQKHNPHTCIYIYKYTHIQTDIFLLLAINNHYHLQCSFIIAHLS